MKKALLVLILALASVSLFAQKNKIKIETEYSKIVIMLYDGTPQNTNSMVKLAKEHYYVCLDLTLM